jgi:endonuclease-3
MAARKPKTHSGSPADRRASLALRRLKKAYPDSACGLVHDGPFRLLAATILSAQCTDVMVNKVTPALFAAYPDAPAMARADQEKLEALIRSTGFYRNKAASLIACSRAIVEQHGGEVPRTMEELTAFRGVARKTANVVLGNAFGKNIGVVVDTHVKRLSGRLGFSSQSSPEKIEQDLMPLFPRKDWTLLSHLLIDHGRAVCPSRKPKCGQCTLADICPSAEQ